MSVTVARKTRRLRRVCERRRGGRKRTDARPQLRIGRTAAQCHRARQPNPLMARRAMMPGRDQGAARGPALSGCAGRSRACHRPWRAAARRRVRPAAGRHRDRIDHGRADAEGAQQRRQRDEEDRDETRGQGGEPQRLEGHVGLLEARDPADRLLRRAWPGREVGRRHRRGALHTLRLAAGHGRGGGGGGRGVRLDRGASEDAGEVVGARRQALVAGRAAPVAAGRSSGSVGSVLPSGSVDESCARATPGAQSARSASSAGRGGGGRRAVRHRADRTTRPRGIGRYDRRSWPWPISSPSTDSAGAPATASVARRVAWPAHAPA